MYDEELVEKEEDTSEEKMSEEDSDDNDNQMIREATRNIVARQIIKESTSENRR